MVNFVILTNHLVFFYTVFQLIINDSRIFVKNETFSTPDSRFIPNSGVGLYQAHPYPVLTASPLAPLHL